MGVKVEWAGLYDPEMDESYFVSPRTGELLVLPGATHDDKQRGQLRRKGLDTQTCVDRIEYIDGRFDELPGPQAPDGIFARLRARMMNRFVRIGVRVLPLAGLARFLGTLARVLPKSKREREDVFQLVGWLEGGRVRDDCLPRAMLRWYYLINAGFAPALVLGIWVPTNNMHAWVMLDNRAAGELSDEVMHYQPATVLRWLGKKQDDAAAAKAPATGEMRS